MPRKTLALISGLVLVTVVLFIVALKAGQNQTVPNTTPKTVVQAKPTIPAHSVLAIAPNPLTVAPGQQGKADVTIDTGENNVNAVQLEIGYDPTMLTNVKVTAGTLIANPAVLIDRDVPTKGRYTYAFGITPNGKAFKGTGVVATITFTTKPGAVGKDTQLGLLLPNPPSFPGTMVTEAGVADSVMKSSTGTVVSVRVGAAGGAASGAAQPAQ